MSKIDTIDSFLKLLTEISRNSIEISPNLVYANLTTFGIAKKEKINIFFEQWINRYKNNRKIDVFNAEYWKYFCQFKSRNCNESGFSRVKLYVSLDKDHIYNGANKIFDFLSSNNIDHISKIGSDTRIDDIVIRLNNPNDAEKLKRFIESDAYIIEGIIKPNAFAFNDGIVALAWDGNMSYNDVVSNWISDYINNAKRKNELSNVSYNNFYKYILQEYKKIFIEGQKIKEFASNKKLNKNYDDIFLNLANYADITKLFLKALDPHNNLYDYYNEWKNITSNNYQKDSCEKMKSHYEKDGLVKATQEDKKISEKKTHYIDNNIIDIIDSAFEKMKPSYGEEQTQKAFEAFSITENYYLITRTNNARNLLIENQITKEMVAEYINMKKIEIINAAIIETNNKYGKTHTLFALNHATSNFYACFTNSSGNNRKKLQQTVAPEQFNNLLFQSMIKDGYQIEDINNNLYETYYNKVINAGRKKTA